VGRGWSAHAKGGGGVRAHELMGGARWTYCCHALPLKAPQARGTAGSSPCRVSTSGSLPRAAPCPPARSAPVKEVAVEGGDAQALGAAHAHDGLPRGGALQVVRQLGTQARAVPLSREACARAGVDVRAVPSVCGGSARGHVLCSGDWTCSVDWWCFAMKGGAE